MANQKPIKHNGMTFDTEKELNRYRELKILDDAWAIEDLERNVKIPLYVNGQLITSYTCDFVYYDRKQNKIMYESTKGSYTPEYKMKKKLLKACCNIEIVEI